ncbi:MAG: acetyltransferase [Crocinitomicaceae bacterium]|jgi:putative acetyltransferase|nr:acetyltransferase [Crocinitomicaceae bacterium]
MEKIVYRLVQPGDNAELAAMIRGVLEEFGVNQPGTVYTDPTTDRLYELFAEVKAPYRLALDGEKIIGACGLYPTPGLPKDCVELVKFYVNSAYRGLGIGKKLMNMSLEDAKNLGYTSVYLESLPQLNTAVGMYEKAGFEHIPERLGESGHFACNILMLKKL